METKNMIGGIVSLAVVVICVAAIMMPVLSEYTNAELTYTNEGMPYDSPDGEDHTITVTSSAITVDGEEVDQTLFPSGFTQYTIVFTSDGDFIRIDTSGVTVRTVTDALTSYSYSSGETITIAISETTATVSSSDTSKTASSISGVTYYISTEGDYVLTLNPYVTSESPIAGAGSTLFATTTGIPTGMGIYLAWSGTIDAVEGEVLISQLTSAGTAPTSITVSDISVNTTEIDGDLVKIDSVLVTMTAEYSNQDDVTLTSTYTYFVAPAVVTYDDPDYLGSGNSALLLAIPAIIIAALIVAAVGTFVIGRRD